MAWRCPQARLGSHGSDSPPLSPACSPGISRSTSPNPASPVLPEACWRGTAQRLKGPQQEGSPGRKQDDREESSDTTTTPQGRVSSSTSQQTLPRRPARSTRGNLLPPTCLLQGYRGPRPSPCTPRSASGRPAPAHAPGAAPARRGRLPTETHPQRHGPGRPAEDARMRLHRVNTDRQTSELLAPCK